ncbi:MAG: fumarylacetoacetate hydrolase family protein [Pseudomonadota bacterium]
MRLYRYYEGDTIKLAIKDGERLVNPLETLRSSRALSPAEAKVLSDTIDFIGAGSHALELARESLAITGPAAKILTLGELRLAAPIMPTTILCSGSNYRDHNAEKANTEMSGKEPEFFVKTADCVIGPDDAIMHSERLTKKLDGETELAVVIGKAGRNIPVENALDHVFGYTIINDLTARDLQVHYRADGTVWYEIGRGKVFDCSAPLGPCIVTSDEIGDPQLLDIKTRVNGELRQISNTSNMIFSVAQLVHFFSLSMTLKPGIVLITGTPSGTAWSCDTSLGGKWKGTNGMIPAKGYLADGDVFEAEIGKIGILKNTVSTSA